MTERIDAINPIPQEPSQRGCQVTTTSDPVLSLHQAVVPPSLIMNTLTTATSSISPTIVTVSHEPATTALLTSHLRTLNTAARTWLRQNSNILRHLTELLRTLSLLSPNSELHSELAASFLSLLGLYRDLTPSQPLPSIVLTLLSSIQLPLEMLARRRTGQRGQLSAITALETAKLLFRLSLIFSRSKLGKIHTLQSEQLQPPPVPPVCTCGLQQVPGAQLVTVKRGRRSGRKVLLPERNLSKGSNDPILDALFLIAYERRASWIVRMLVPNVSCEACAERRVEESSLGEGVEGVATAYAALKPSEIAAEVMYVARPLLHLILIRRFGWRSWKAWVVALLVDLGSRGAMAPPKGDEEIDEKRRRMAQLLLYLGRSPLFDMLLRIVVRRLTSPLRWVPLVGGAASSAVEWVTLLQQYWFYTSGS